MAQMFAAKNTAGRLRLHCAPWGLRTPPPPNPHTHTVVWGSTRGCPLVGAPVGRPPVWGGAQGRGGYGVCCGSVGWGVVSVGGRRGGAWVGGGFGGGGMGMNIEMGMEIGMGAGMGWCWDRDRNGDRDEMGWGQKWGRGWRYLFVYLFMYLFIHFQVQN